MQKTRSVFVLFVGVLALCGGVTVGQTVRSDSKTAVSQAQREFDPDAGSEAPFDAGQYDGEVAVAADGCESNGAFTATFTATTRYRGNLYRVTHSGVFLREIKMQLAFAGTADLFVSVHKKDLDGTYSQIDINSSNASLKHIVIPGAEGSGETIPEFYGTGGLGGVEGVPLPPGDYAIAFSWGPFSIKYGRDSGVTYPRSFAVGSIRGSVATDLLQNEPPMRDILPAMSVFTGGVYSMQICLVPAAGACCQSTTQSCVEVFEEECLGAGSFFHGQRTLCAETPCNFGACCFECAQQVGFPVRCEDGYAPERCSLDGGAAHWPGVSCPPGDAALCPKVTGACCNGVDCTLQCEAECLTNQGTYRGDGTDCEPDFCQGACCSSSGCFNTTQTNCTTFAGPLAFRGAGTLCETLPPNLECGGACCSGSETLSSCGNVARRDLCKPDGSGFPPKIAYRGDNTTCSQPCGLIDDYNACCLPNGTCLNTTQDACTQPTSPTQTVQGIFIAGSRCETLAPEQCSNQVARCCFNDGSCQLLTGTACDLRPGGTPVPGEFVCPAGACASFGGACCGGGPGVCTDTTEAECIAQGGIYRGDDSECSTASCPGLGGCCRSNGDCFNGLSTTECQTIGGFYEGNGVFCDAPQVDCDERGACCTQTGSCLFVDEAACMEINGEFKGVGFTCSGNVCKGGCCEGAACSVKTEEACFGVGGIYFGDGSSCTANACSPGACCRAVGTCQNGVQGGFCSGAGEVFHVAALCANVLCVPSGACCSGQNCTVTTQAACQGVYRGNGVLCTPDTCAATGACCNGTTCSTATQSACTTGGGVYKGDNSVCGANTCPATGACCNATLCATKSQADCLSGGGEYKGDNIACGVNTCPAAATGACCDGANCTVTTQVGCTGTYQGDGVLCEANTCQVAPQCTAITGSVPANCSIDARRPYPPNAPGAPEGWRFIELTFNCDPANHVVGDYSVAVFAIGVPPAAPTVLSVTPLDATRVRLNLSSPIPPGAWTCFTYVPSSLTRCVGFLPGDVDGNRTTVPADILKLIDNLNGIAAPPLDLDHCDMDRSNICAPADIISLIDMLNGTNGYIVWNGQSIVACPSP